jgi:hypothetical protein
VTHVRRPAPRHGIAGEEAERQLRILRGPARHRRLVRPCTPGDGIERLDADAERRLSEQYGEAAERGRLRAFVPASGAATRMFKDLLAWRPGAPVEEPVRAFVEGLPRFAFAADLRAALGADPAAVAARDLGRVLDVLLGEVGLGYAALPKGLLRFHGARTAFEEHLVDAAAILRDGDDRCRLSFTVSPEHMARFEALAAERREELEPGLGVTYELDFSTQRPATDTVAVDGQGRLFRRDDGALLLRPAGHGALLANLRALDADLVFIRNVDNVAAEGWKEPGLRWARALAGRLVELEKERELAGAPPRPLRVCGMVPNTGEPGGGPYWVEGSDGRAAPQIVESAEVDLGDPAQQAIFRAATHFNPVFMVCALRDRRGTPYDLPAFADEDASIVTRKSSGGRELVALERPGLWNGGMAAWDTVFVEVPLEVFTPVKTVNDLLRREHQPRA